MKRRATAAIILLAATAQVAGAQVRMAVTGVATRVGSSIVVQGVAEDGTGSWVGGRGVLEAGLFTAEFVALRGTLAPSGGSAGLERDGGEMRAVAGIRPIRWLTVEGGYTLRAFDSPAGYQKWTIPSAGLRLATDLGTRALRGYVRGAYAFGVSVSGQSAATLGLMVESGFELAPRRVPVSLALFHRFERYDFPDGAAGRLEHFDVLGVALGFGFGR